MSFLNNIARYILEDRPVQELPGIAIEGLEEGIYTPTMILLAGMADNQNPFLFDDYFLLLLKELEISFLLDKVQSVAFLIKSTAFGIIQHDIDAYEGCNKIFQDLLIYIDDKYLAGKYAYDDIGLAKVYSAYITIEELASATEQWSTEKSNDQLISETRTIIKSELLKWLVTSDNRIFNTSA